MNANTTNNTLKLSMVENSTVFKMTVKKSLEEKIRFMCAQLPHNEWSGTLFYTVTGGFESNDLHIFAEDFYLQDVGEGTFTEFQNDVTLAGYVVDHQLWDCYTGLIHSHNTMSTFFSGTDINTVLEEGTEANHFVSLIINNAGIYNAKISRKIDTTITAKVTGNKEVSYRSFGNQLVLLSSAPQEQDFSKKDTILEHFKLKVEIESTDRPQSELEKRLTELKAAETSYINRRKVTTTSIPTTANTTVSSANPTINTTQFRELPQEHPSENTFWEERAKEAYENMKNEKEPTELDLFPEMYQGSDIPYGKLKLDEKFIKANAVQLVTGDIFAAMKPNIDIVMWAGNMTKNYTTRFAIDKKAPFSNFQLFASSMVEVLASELPAHIDSSLYDIYGDDIITAVWAYELRKVLNNLPHNEFLNTYIEEVERWII